MRYIHFIFAFIASIVVSACTTTDIDVYVDPTETPTHGGDLQVVGRITQYTDCDVATRSKKEGDESKVTSMGLALFPIDEVNGTITIGNCLYYDFKLGGSIVFIVDRQDDVFDSYEGRNFAMYIFANLQDAEGFPTTKEAGVGKSLDDFTTCATAASTTVKDVPANGFPMMGSLGNTLNIAGIESDGKTLILKPAKNDDNVDGLPLVDDKPTDNLEIPLKSMYAKFSFTISVKPDQEIVGNKAPRFDLLSYEVNNIPATVDSNSSTNDDNAVIASSGEVTMGSYAQGATTATFEFYLPERYLSPSKALEEVLPEALKKGKYDKDVDDDQNGYRDEDERYHQRFKGKLIEGKNATYITINGKYTDHQEDTYDVSYNIYLGGNNVDDFNIIRNTHYDNSVTIRGISTSDDQSANQVGISIDHRVNVNRSTPLVIGLRRESLLDAHYEVRPLRLRLVGENIPTGTSATVDILNQDGTATNIPTWIRLEASGNTTNHITTDGVSKGKRMYFTTDLVTTTLADSGKSVTVNNLTGTNQTVWIYVDENTTTTSRAAIVRVTYGADTKDFKIVQNGLFKVTGADSGRDYYIEQYEEYLYNYDAEDSYGQTQDEGMPWGLPGVQLSHIHNSFICNETNSDWTNYITNNPIKYDFYIGKHDDDNDNSDVYTKDGGTLHNFAGWDFTKEIAENSNAGFTKLTLDQTANSAVEYCYNRNKRQPDGTIKEEDIVWYLPSADELEDFIVPAYSTFEEFQDNYYWTSQPAYIRNAFYYEYFNGSQSNSNRVDTYVFVTYEDNKTHARATKVDYNNSKYDYVPSGLNLTSENAAIDCNSPISKDTYFNVMYGWYRWTDSEWSWSDFQYHTVIKTNTKTMTADEHYNEYIDGRNTGIRYHVELGHLEDLIQKTEDGDHGYHERTKSNRVRCVRKVASNN